MLHDPEMKELAEAEIEENKEKLPKLEEEIKILLIPKDPNDDKNVICRNSCRCRWRRSSIICGNFIYECILCMQKKNIGN